MYSLLLVLNMFFAQPIAGGNDEVKIKTTAVCGMCKATIERNLSLSPGVKKATLNLEDKVVTIEYNAKKTDVAKLKRNIILSGYDADEEKKDLKAHAALPACCREGCNAAH